MWSESSSFAYGETARSNLVAGLQSSTLGVKMSLGGIQRPTRAVNFIVGGFTAAATFLALANDLPAAQTLESPNYSATAGAFSPQRVTEVLPEVFQEALEEMNGYRFLAAGWDGAGSIPPKPDLVDAAISFFKALPCDICPPEASVAADGSVSWFWNTDAIYATASFTKAGRFAYYAKAKDTGAKVKGIGVLDGSVPQELLDVIRSA